MPARLDAVAASLLGAVVAGAAWGNKRWRDEHTIDPKIEQPTRIMLGHAIRHELEQLASVIQAAGNDTLLARIPYACSHRLTS
jgi:hypothetical protein